MQHRDFTFPTGQREVLVSPSSPYGSSQSSPSNSSAFATYAPSNASSSPFVSLASPSHRSSLNGVSSVKSGGSNGAPGSPTSPRLPFSSIPEPHDPLLEQLNGKVTGALEPVSVLHQQLMATTASLSSYLSSSNALMSSLSSHAPTATLSHYTTFHAALLSSCHTAGSFFSVEVLYPLTDWLDDATQCTVELGHTQSTRHQLDRAQDEIQSLFEMKLTDAVPPSIDELIESSKDGLERLSSLYAGQVEGVQKSVRRVLESKARVLEVVARNVMEWEWRVMKRWRRIAEVQARKPEDAHTDEEEKEEDDAADDEEDEDDDPERSGQQPNSAEHSRVAPSRRKYSHSEELIRHAADDEDDDGDLLSPLSMSDGEDGSESDSSVPPSPASDNAPSSFSPITSNQLNFPWKAPYPASSSRLHSLPFPALPLSSALSSSVWLALFSSAYKWDEARDELVCQYEVREGGGKEDVERAFRRRKHSSRAVAPTKKVALLTPKREDEVDRVIKRLQMSAQELVEAILSVDVEKLTADKVERLVDVLPTADETQALKNALAESSDSSSSLLQSLSPASLLLCSLISPIHPSLITRIQCLHFHYQLPQLSSSLITSFSLLQSACTEVRDSSPFQHVLAVILEVFNFLHPQRVAYAFDVSLLGSLSSLSTPHCPSFLTFLVAYLAAHFPTLLAFPASLPSLHRASRLTPSALTALHAQLTAQLARYRQLLDDLDASSDPDDRTARLGWMPLYERAVETMERVEKRLGGMAGRGELLCRWLCWEGRKGDLKPAEAKEVREGKRLTGGCDLWSLLRVLEDFVADFVKERRKEERRRRRKDRFKVNLREEKIKDALQREERRRRDEDKHRPQSPPARPNPRVYDEPVHSAVLYAPYHQGAPTFSELHEKHSPPAVERMARAPSLSFSSADAPQPPPPMLSAVHRESRTASGGDSSAAKRGAPVFSVSGPASGSKGDSADRSRAGSSSSGGSSAASPKGAMTPVEFAASVVGDDRPSSRRDSGGGRGGNAQKPDSSHDLPQSPPVNLVRLPFASHFTYHS